MNGNVYVDCPCCGLNQLVWVPLSQMPSTTLHLCDIDLGGCDEEFAVRIEWVAKTKVLKLISPTYNMEPTNG